MIALRSVLFNVLFFGYTALTALRMLPLLLDRHGDVVPGIRRWSNGILWLLDKTVGITFTVRGADNIPQGAAVIAAKHQSAWDTIMFHCLVPSVAYVVKQEITRIPLYGAYTRRAGSIVVDRKGGAGAMKNLVRDCRAALERGGQVVIFPEGTRTAPRARVAYQPGVAALYNQLGVAVMPVALNSGLYWGRRSFIKRPGCIVVEFLPAIPPGLERRRFLAELEVRIETATRSLIEEVEGVET